MSPGGTTEYVHSYVSNRMHCVFSTKERRKLIDEELEARLWPYIVGIARQNDFQNRSRRRSRGPSPPACALTRTSVGEHGHPAHKRRIVEMDSR